MTPDARTWPSDARILLGGLSQDERQGFRELRVIRSRTVVAQLFVPGDDPDAAWSAIEPHVDDSDVFFSVALRTRREGTKEATGPALAAWVDLDASDAETRLEAFAHSPSFVVASGSEGHRHGYWLLAEPAAHGEIETINRALARELGGDEAAVDASRVMRLPGTSNHKVDPPAVARLVAQSGRWYTLAELWEALGKDPQAEDTGTGSDSPSPGVGNGPSPPVARVLDQLEGVKPTSQDWSALCPAHDDQRPSLSVAEADDGRCLIHCFAGCTPEAVVAAIGLTMSDLYPQARRGSRAASRLVDLADDAGIDLFHSPNLVAHASVAVGDHRETHEIRSRSFEMWLRRQHYEAHGEALPADVLADATKTLEARALFDGRECEVFRRVGGPEPGRLLVDLGDDGWRAIEIDAGGWRLLDHPDVHFVRDPTMLPLPEPARGGSIEDLRPFTNCASEAAWLRLWGVIVGAFHPRGPYVVAYPTGEQGSAKSTHSRMIVSLIDPRLAPLMMGTPTVRDLAVVSNSVWLVGFDNVSRVSDALSDALCQLATGGGYRARQLYTDGDTFVIDVKRPVVLNAIGQVIIRPDLLDRVVPIELAPIPPEKRRPEEEFWADWERARPRVLGGVFDAVAAALNGAAEVELDGFPRMADFARWGEAALTSWGTPPGAFTAALENARQELLESGAEASPVIGAILALMEDREEWVGSATELGKALGALVDEAVVASRDWPKRPDRLSNQLERHAPLLRTHGIEITRGREGGGNRRRFLRITRRRDAGTPGDA